MHYEALALHSFTDLFAFGHLMENRHLTMKIVKWAEGSVLRSLAKLIGKAASLVLGVLPYERRACADPQTAVQRQVIVEATAASIADVLRVAAGGTLEAGKELQGSVSYLAALKDLCWEGCR